MIKLTDITLSYYGTPALEIDEFSAGESFAVIGCSGSGKSNFLKVIAGLERIDNGYIYIGSEEVGELKPGKRGISLISSRTPLISGKSVYKNLVYPLKKRRYKKEYIAAAINSVLPILMENDITRSPRFNPPLSVSTGTNSHSNDSLHHDTCRDLQTDNILTKTDDILSKKVKNLTKQERTRLILARALVKNPRLILLDEPSDVVEDIELFCRILKESGKFFVLTTYDFSFAQSLVNHFVVMRGGRIVFSGDGDKLKDCADQYIQKMCF